jgi:hypothetical protein
MALMKRYRLKASSISLVILLVMTASVAAQQVPRKKKNLTFADREAWHKILRWPDEYEDYSRKMYENSDYGGLSLYDLGRGHYLVEVDAYPVAYQSGFIYVIYDERNRPNGPGRLLLLKGFESKDKSGHPLPYSKVSAAVTKFHAKTKVLEVTSKYRAAGDCGLYVRYKFINSRPVVIEAREQECDLGGRRPAQLDPSRWPRKKL